MWCPNCEALLQHAHEPKVVLNQVILVRVLNCLECDARYKIAGASHHLVELQPGIQFVGSLDYRDLNRFRGMLDEDAKSSEGPFDPLAEGRVKSLYAEGFALDPD